MSKNSGGEVTYEIVADDSQLESDLNEAGKKVEKSAKKTAKKSEDAEKESAEVKKSVKEDVTKKKTMMIRTRIARSPPSHTDPSYHL